MTAVSPLSPSSEDHEYFVLQQLIQDAWHPDWHDVMQAQKHDAVWQELRQEALRQYQENPRRVRTPCAIHYWGAWERTSVDHACRKCRACFMSERAEGPVCGLVDTHVFACNFDGSLLRRCVECHENQRPAYAYAKDIPTHEKVVLGV